jgi:signal transduction histidine kinase
MLYPEEVEKVFERSFRGRGAKAVTDGTGAGLHFAKLVCDLHNVMIRVESDQTEILRINGIPYSNFRVKIGF